MHKNHKSKRLLCLTVAILMLVAAFPSTSLAAERASVNRITIIMNPQGGSGGTLQIDVENGVKMPSIDPPTRWGYAFAGYWSVASGRGKQYYNAQGASTVTCDFTQNTALYAHWTIKTMRITYQNMEGATFGTNAPPSHTYGANTKVSDPTKAGYTFFGWQVNDSTVASQGLVLGAAAYNADITLTAVWNKAALVTLIDNTAGTVTMPGDDLRKVFTHQVTDPTAGVTIDDLNSEEVKLTLTAKDADDLAEGAADIIGLAQGDVLKFYDFSIHKTVTKLGGNPVITNLHELPNTVQVEIALGASLKSSSAYRVYRYHGGRAEAIPHGPITDSTGTRESFELSPTVPNAQNVFLSKVPVEGADAPSINAYLRLNGSPTDPEFYKGLVTNELGYVKIANITVIIGYLGGPRTPRR